MNLPTASLILRQHMALIDEGRGPRDPDINDVKVLAEAVHIAGHLYTTAQLHEFRLVDEDGTPTAMCPARSWGDQDPCAHLRGHPRVTAPGRRGGLGDVYDHGNPDAGTWWNER